MQIDENKLNTRDDNLQQLWLSKRYTIITNAFGVMYSLVWAIVYIIYSEQSLPSHCNSLLNWSRAVYIILLISCVLNIASTIYQLIYYKLHHNASIPRLVLGVKTLYSYVIAIVMIIGVTVAYFKTKRIESCGKLRYVNLGYIISEWILTSACIVCFFSICIYALFCSSSKKKYRNDVQLSEVEMRKLC